MASKRDHTNEYSLAERKENRLLAGMSYFGLLCFVPFFASDSKFAHFHARQGTIFFINDLLLLILIVVLAILKGVKGIAGTAETLEGFITVFFLCFNLFMFLYGAINGFCGKAKELPLIGGIGKK